MLGNKVILRRNWSSRAIVLVHLNILQLAV
jgi:hypothetical protein